MIDKVTLTEGLTALGAVFNREITPAVIAGYEIGLKDMTEDEFKRAFTMSLAKSSFFPKPIELRELISGRASDAIMVRALEFWAVVAEACVDWCRGVEPPVLDRFGGAALVSVGGLTALKYAEPDDLHKWKRKAFLDVYVVLARNEEAQWKDEQRLEEGDGPKEIEG